MTKMSCDTNKISCQPVTAFHCNLAFCVVEPMSFLRNLCYTLRRKNNMSKKWEKHIKIYNRHRVRGWNSVTVFSYFHEKNSRSLACQSFSACQLFTLVSPQISSIHHSSSAVPEPGRTTSQRRLSQHIVRCVGRRRWASEERRNREWLIICCLDISTHQRENEQQRRRAREKKGETTVWQSGKQNIFI